MSLPIWYFVVNKHFKDINRLICIMYLINVLYMLLRDTTREPKQLLYNKKTDGVGGNSELS